ncbi:MAG: hypothetical protein ACRCYU_21990 [Nocardioides sp.]
MGTRTRRTLGILLATVGAAATFTMVGAPPAMASSSCSISKTICTTGNVRANADGDDTITITALPGAGNVTCRAYDYHTSVQVGSVTANWTSGTNSTTIGGLYGLYYAICTQNSGKWGGGSIR